MNAQQLIARLEWVEVDGSYAADCRRVMRDERMGLVVALQGGDGTRIAARLQEALRVARMWGVL